MEEVGEKMDIFMQKEGKIHFVQRMLLVLCLIDIINIVNILEMILYKLVTIQLVYLIEMILYGNKLKNLNIYKDKVYYRILIRTYLFVE